MSIFDNLHLAVRTRTIDDAGTSSGFNLTVNVDATDILDKNFSVDLDDGEATLLGGPFPETLDSNLLTNTSVRLGIRGDDAWAPQDVLLFGLAFERNELAALAMETDLSDADLLSTDYREGKLSMPMRLVSRGSSSTLIRRVLLLVDTIWQSWTDTETDSPIELEITAGGNLVLLQEVIDTPQPDLEAGKSNWYPLDAAVPFTRADVLANGSITLRLKGADAWKPMRLFLFGLDTATGRPNEVVSLVSIPVWPHGWMSTDTKEGKPSVTLDVVSI